MPGFDGTGPTGTGPMSGGGRGRCIAARDEAPASNVARLGRLGMRPRMGRRFAGRGRGFGAGR